MDENMLKQIAAQLRKPEGIDGIKTAESMNDGNKFMNLNTIEIVNPSANDRILEIGMGNGFFVKEILKKDKSINYTGIDFSELMVNESRKVNEEWIGNGQAQFFVADVASLPIPTESVDKIFTVNTLYFWEDTKETFNEIKRVLKPFGQLIIAIRPKRQMENYPFTKYGFQMFDKEQLSELLKENGFTSVRIHENKEPDYEFNGRIMKMENIIATALR